MDKSRPEVMSKWKIMQSFEVSDCPDADTAEAVVAWAVDKYGLPRATGLSPGGYPSFGSGVQARDSQGAWASTHPGGSNWMKLTCSGRCAGGAEPYMEEIPENPVPAPRRVTVKGQEFSEDTVAELFFVLKALRKLTDSLEG